MANFFSLRANFTSFHNQTLSQKRAFSYFHHMTKTLPAFLFACAGLLLFAVSTFAVPRTMRLDYYHTGNSRQETFSLDQIQIEPLPWPGDLSKSIDESNLGKYFF